MIIAESPESTEYDGVPRSAIATGMVVGVRYFFYAEAFAALEEAMVPKLFAGKNSGDAIRVWSVGCSTGEEAYSIAVLLYEYMESLHENYDLRVPRTTP